jgi:hypothetical protein
MAAGSLAMLWHMPQSLANYDAALKNIYAPGLRNSINYSNPVLTEVVRDTTNVSGRKCIWAVHSGRSASTGARAEFGVLPVADRQRYIAPEDNLRYQYHTIKVSGQARHLTQNNAGAFAKALDQEMTFAAKDVKTDLARQMFNAAVTINSLLTNGSLAQAHTITDSTHIVIESLEATDADVAADTNDPVYRLFFVGQLIDAVNPSDGTIHATFSVTAVVPGTGITTTTNTGAVADDFLFRSGNQVAGQSLEVNGLRFLIGTQSYASVTAATNPVWNGNAVGSSTTGISENLLESAIEKVETDGDGSTPTLGLAEHKQGRKLATIVQQQKRYAPPAVTLEAGWKGIEVAGLNLVFDRFCPGTQIFVLTPSELAWFVGLDWTWDDDDGKVLYKALDGSDAVEARYKAYVNLQSYTRNAHTLVTAALPVF